jgi:RNA polymerase sigma-70 factor, ECF subfamily
MLSVAPLESDAHNPASASTLHPDDRALLDAVRRDEPGGTEALYRALSPTVRRVVNRIVGHHCGDRDDIVQVAFEKLMGSVVQGTFSGACPLRRWSASIAANAAFDYHRARTRERKVLCQDIDIEVAAAQVPRFDGERPTEAREEVARLSAILETMKPLDARVLLLHHGLGYTVKEVAEVVRSSDAATYSRLRRARRDLLGRASKLGLGPSYTASIGR